MLTRIIMYVSPLRAHNKQTACIHTLFLCCSILVTGESFLARLLQEYVVFLTAERPFQGLPKKNLLYVKLNQQQQT